MMAYMEKYLSGLCSYTGIFMNNITKFELLHSF